MDESVFNPDFQAHHVEGKIVAGLERISEAFRVLLWEEAKNLGLSPIQIQILIFIKYHSIDICNVSALALEFNLTKPTISDAVKMLHAKKLLTKIPSTSDRRAYSMKLTAKGEKIVDKTKDFTEPINAIMESFSKNEQRQFFHFISKTIQHLNRTGLLTVQRSCSGCQYFDRRRKQPYCQLIQEKLIDGVRIDCPDFEAMDD